MAPSKSQSVSFELMCAELRRILHHLMNRVNTHVYHSYGGYVAIFYGGRIQWKTKLQPTVAQYSSEDKFIAVSLVSKGCVATKGLIFHRISRI